MMTLVISETPGSFFTKFLGSVDLRKGFINPVVDDFVIPSNNSLWRHSNYTLYYNCHGLAVTDLYVPVHTLTFSLLIHLTYIPDGLCASPMLFFLYFLMMT